MAQVTSGRAARVRLKREQPRHGGGSSHGWGGVGWEERRTVGIGRRPGEGGGTCVAGCTPGAAAAEVRPNGPTGNAPRPAATWQRVDNVAASDRPEAPSPLQLHRSGTGAALALALALHCTPAD